MRELRIELAIAHAKIASCLGLNARDLDVLDVIERFGACTAGTLASQTGISPATLTGILFRLERDGWLVREPDPRDRRSLRLAATRRFDEIRALYSAGNARVLDLVSRLTASEASAVEEFLVNAAREIRVASNAIDA